MCTEHAHYERPLINGIFYIHVDKMFEFLFTDCDFYRQLAEAKKMYGKHVLDETYIISTYNKVSH